MTQEKSESRDAKVLRLVAEVISGLQVPYSITASLGRTDQTFGTAARPLVELWQELGSIGYPPPDEFEQMLRRALERPVPEGWERCRSRLDTFSPNHPCNEAGKWGASVDPKKYGVWTRRHRMHHASLSHHFLVHEVEPIPEHDAQMPHRVGEAGADGCPPNCPFRLAVERYRKED